MQLLMRIGVMNAEEQLTPLGMRLSHVSAEPQLAKMALMAYLLGI